MSKQFVIPPDVSLHLDQLEERIKTNDAESIFARLESGRAMNTLAVGKQLPRGVLAQLCAKYKKKKSELEDRRRFAQAHPGLTREQLSTLMETCPTWTAIKNSLVKKPRSRPRTTPLARALATIERADPAELSADDRQLVFRLAKALTTLTEAA